MNWQEKAELFEKYDIPVVKTEAFDKLEEASKAFEKFKKPIVVKSELKDLGHRTEKGEVITGIKTKKELKKAFREVKNSNRVLVQEQAEGRELIIGGKKDPVFGQVLMFGVGGVFTEVYEDVAFRVAPIDKKEAGKMIRDIKGYKLLKKFRGKKAVKTSLLEKVLANTSKMLVKEEIRTLDVNPFIINSETGVAVDIKIEK